MVFCSGNANTERKILKKANKLFCFFCVVAFEERNAKPFIYPQSRQQADVNRSRGSLQCGPAQSGSPEPGEKVKQYGQHLCDELDDGAQTGRYLGHGMDYYVDILLTF